jgi:hypothetical protein
MTRRRRNLPPAAEFRFRIDVFSPETLPMRRLAEYMIELARLFGNEEHVHFSTLRRGSAVLVQTVDFEAAPKVRARLRSAASPDAPEDVRRPWRKIDGMLADDNAVGKLSEKAPRGLVIEFPGRLSRGAEIGPVAEEGSIEGILVRIGGEDRSAHAHLQSGEDTLICELSRDLARQLGQHLYGAPIRVSGRGRWRRTSEGRWHLIDFKATSFKLLDAATLRESVDRLRQVEGSEWRGAADPIAELRKLRHGT